jgi:hypothetical protein
MSLDPAADSTLRTSDAEREHVVAALGLHLSVGRLTMSEFENRLDTAYAARTRRELDAVLADLPTTPPQPAPPPPRRNPLAGRRWAPWALTGAICLLIWVAASSAQGHPLYFWPFWVVGPWGAMLLTQAAIARTRSRADHGDSTVGPPTRPGRQPWADPQLSPTPCL